jgi:hypothetical protein
MSEHAYCSTCGQKRLSERITLHEIAADLTADVIAAKTNS